MDNVAGLIGELPRRLTDAAGGPARRKAVLLLAGALSLETADSGTVGALAGQLERTFHVGNTQIGLLITANSLVSAIGSLPMGVVTDKTRRVPVLVATITLWAASMVASGFATSYLMLLLTRLALGLASASAGPMVASLTGDLFPAQERARIYGMVLTGELIGAGAGLVISADIASFASWRAPFFVLAVPSAALAYFLYRMLPEPARGGQSWLRRGDEEIKGIDALDGEAPDGARPSRVRSQPTGLESSEVRRQARRRTDVEPRPGQVLRQDPRRMSPWTATVYILRIPSNLVLVATSVLAYFFLAGARAFAVLFAESHFQLSTGLVTLMFVPIGAGAAVGTLGGGRLVDALVRKGQVDARVLISGIFLVVSALLFVPGLVLGQLWLALPVLVLATAFLAAPNPALDAARLDVVPSRLWGRGEGVRTFAQSLLQAIAPLTFGYVSSLLGGPKANLGAGVNASTTRLPPAVGIGLEDTFLIMLVPLIASGALLLASRKAYLRDVATADLSERSR